MYRSDRDLRPGVHAERRSHPSSRVGRSLAGLLAWITDHARGSGPALGVFLFVGLALVAGAILLFAAIAALLSEGFLLGFDRAVLLWLDRQATPRLDGLALDFTALGSATVALLVVIIASALLWEARRRVWAIFLCVALLGGWMLSWALKSLFHRTRPDLFEWRVPYAGSSSYPSGHSITAMVVYASLAYLFLRLGFSRPLRRIMVVVFALIILLVGVSRVYLGVHYPSDVIGGFLVGFAWATVCALGAEAVQDLGRRKV